MTSNDKTTDGRTRVDVQPDATDGSSLCLQTNCSANTGDSLLPPCVTRVRQIGHYGRDRPAVAARPKDVRALGRSRTLTTTRRANWIPWNRSGTAQHAT